MITAYALKTSNLDALKSTLPNNWLEPDGSVRTVSVDHFILPDVVVFDKIMPLQDQTDYIRKPGNYALLILSDGVSLPPSLSGLTVPFEDLDLNIY